MPEIALDSYTRSKSKKKNRLEPSGTYTVPEVHIDADEALIEIESAVKKLEDYRKETVNTIGQGEVVHVVQRVGTDSKGKQSETMRKHSNRVLARWLLRRAIHKLYPEVVKIIDWADPKFDARIELASAAALRLKAHAEELVELYLDHSELRFEIENPYTVGPVFVNHAKAKSFKHAVHDSYSDLNQFELDVANSLDRTKCTWARNPSNGGFTIPLLQAGESRRFFPDFLVWHNGKVFALDPKGDHLIASAASRKLLDIQDEKGRRKLVVRLMTEGQWGTEPVKRKGSGGYTIWSLRAGSLRGKHYDDLDSAVEGSLKV
jgi:type III restriction enzyme